MRDLRDRLGRPGHPDYWLIGATAALLMLGLNMVYSSSFVLAHNNPAYADETYFVVRQALWASLGIVAIVVLMRLDYRLLRRVSVLALVGTILLLVAVLLPGLGVAEYGASRWLRFGPMTLQPSELAKLATILFFADWLARKGDHVKHLSYGTLPFAVILSIVCGLIMLQPDLGTTSVVIASAVAVFFLAGANLFHFGLGMLGIGGVIWLLIQGAAYRLSRWQVYLNPESDPLGQGWHILQSTIAVGSGGLFGVGAGASRQKHFYLFGAHNDAIFAVIAEETGLIGCLFVLVLFGIVAYRGYRITLSAPDRFGALLAAGITCKTIFQALINIAVVIGVVPFTGITLPFISYGGSSLFVLLIGVGILLSISCRANAVTPAAPPPEPRGLRPYPPVLPPSRPRLSRPAAPARPTVAAPVGPRRRTYGG